MKLCMKRRTILGSLGISKRKIIISRRAWLAFAGAFATSFAMAGTPGPVAADALIAQFAPAAPKVRFIASAVLLRSAGVGPVKLIHSSPIAASEDEALGVLTRSARQKFPGYTIEMTAAAPLSIPSVACFKEGKPADGQALYIVSAVLSEGVGSSTPAMLINGSSYTFSADDARKRFLSEVAQQYPDPVPLEVLATEQKNVVPTPCPARGKWGAA